MCGVFGVYAPDRDVARLTYFGLFALQHRGQESAGIAVSEHGPPDRAARPRPRRAGLRRAEAARPARRGRDRPHALLDDRLVAVGERAAARPPRPRAHGRARPQRQPVNAPRCATSCASAGVTLRATSDSEVIAALIANDEAPLEEAVANAMRRLEGAYSIVALREGTLVAFRDPHGFRPLVLGRSSDDWVVASETCALDLVGAEFVREVAPRRGGADRRRRAAVGAGGRAGRTAARSASSSSSTSRGPTRSSRASRCTARACGWASGSRRRRRPTPTSCCRSPTRARRRRSASRARPASRSARA